MTNRTVVIRKKSCSWQPKTKKNTKPIIDARSIKSHAAGFISPVFIVLACVAFSGLFYIYSINQTAVKGIAVQRVQQEVDQQKKQNESLRIQQAQLESLYQIEDASKNLNMVEATKVDYLEENPAVAFKSGGNGKN